MTQCAVGEELRSIWVNNAECRRRYAWVYSVLYIFMVLNRQISIIRDPIAWHTVNIRQKHYTPMIIQLNDVPPKFSTKNSTEKSMYDTVLFALSKSRPSLLLLLCEYHSAEFYLTCIHYGKIVGKRSSSANTQIIYYKNAMCSRWSCSHMFIERWSKQCEPQYSFMLHLQ